MSELTLDIVQLVTVFLVDDATGKSHRVGTVRGDGNGRWQAKTHQAGTTQEDSPTREAAIRLLLLLYEGDLAKAARKAQADYETGLLLLAAVTHE